MKTQRFFGPGLALALLVTLGGTVAASTALGTSAQDSVRNINATGPSPISMPNYWSYYLGDGNGTWGGTRYHAHSGDYSAFLQTRSYGSSDSVNVGLIAGKSDGYSGPEAYPIQASTTYSFSFWTRGDLQGAQPYALVWTSDEANSSERQWVSMAGSIDPSGDWTHHEGIFTTPADAHKFVVMFKAIGDSSQVSLGTLYVDDLQVRLDGGANIIQNPGAEESVLRSGQVVIWDTNKKYDYKHYGFEAIKDRESWTQVSYGTTGYTFAGDAVIQSDYYWVSLHSSPYDAVFLYANVDGHDSRHNELYRSWDTPNGCRNYGHGSSLNTIIKNEPHEVIIESAAIPRERCGYTATVTTRYRALAGRAWLEISPVSQASEQGMHGESRFNVSPNLPSDGSDAVVDSLRHGLGGGGERVYMPDESEMLLDFVMDADLIWQMTWPTPAHERARSDTAAGGYNAGWSYVGEGDCERVITSPFIRYSDEKVIIGVHYKDYWHYQKIGQSVQASVPYAGSWQRAYERALPHGLYPVGSPWTPGYPGQWRLVGSVDGNYYVNEVTITDTNDDTFTFVSPVDGTLEYVVMYLYDRTEGTPDDVTTPMDVYREAIAAPEVVSVAPTGIFVPLTPTLSIAFSEPMSRTVTEGDISSSSEITPTNFAWSADDDTVNFVPSASLIHATAYTVTVNTAATDLEGEHLFAPYSWQFTTRPEVMWQVYLPVVWKE